MRLIAGVAGMDSSHWRGGRVTGLLMLSAVSNRPGSGSIQRCTKA